MERKIFHIYCGWEEKHYGSSDGATHDCSVMTSYTTKEKAIKGLKEKIGDIKEQIKSDLDGCDYEYDEANLRQDSGSDFCRIIYDNEKMRLEYNLFINEGILIE